MTTTKQIAAGTEQGTFECSYGTDCAWFSYPKHQNPNTVPSP